MDKGPEERDRGLESAAIASQTPQPEPSAIKKPIKLAPKYSPIIGVLTKLLSWAPKIMLLLVIASITLHALYKFGITPTASLESVPWDAALRYSAKAFAAFANPTELNAAALLLLAMVLIASSALFGIGFSIWAFIFLLIISIIMTIFIPFIAPLFGLLQAGDITAIELPTSASIGEVLTFSFRYVLTFIHLAVGFISGWARAQTLSIVGLVVAANALGFSAMLLDKAAAINAADPGKRVPEKEFVRYAGLGGGFGVLAGAILFRHKTKHKALLAHILLSTIASIYILNICLR